MKNNGEEKFLVMCAADENKKAAENKIYKLSKNILTVSRQNCIIKIS